MDAVQHNQVHGKRSNAHFFSQRWQELCEHAGIQLPLPCTSTCTGCCSPLGALTAPVDDGFDHARGVVGECMDDPQRLLSLMLVGAVVATRAVGG